MRPQTSRPNGYFEHSAGTGLLQEQANDFLRKARLDMALRGDRLFITSHRDAEAAEAQRPPTVGNLAEVCRALATAEETPAKLDIAQALLPAVKAQLLEHIEAEGSAETLKDKVKSLAKTYCSVLGGRDLAIDDTIATINTYFFDRIGEDKALNGSNIAAAALTAMLMLVPTIGRNLPAVLEAVREGRYRDALAPAVSICAIAAMTLNPTMAALGLDRASAIAAATGNALMMTNLPHILHHGHEWVGLKRGRFEPETHPFTCFARNNGLVDKGLHTVLDFLHEFCAQAGFFALNVKNAVEAGHSTRSPAAFPLLVVLLGSFAWDTARGEQPFADFEADRKALAGDVTASGSDTRGRAVRLILQQQIAETYDADYGSLVQPLLQRPGGRHVARQFGVNTLSDAEEKTFLKGLLSRFCGSEEARNAVRVAIDRIYRFDRFDPTGNADGDRALGEILRFIQTQRNKDKAFLRGGRGLAHADHVYRNVIAHAIKCAALEELRDQAVSRS